MKKLHLWKKFWKEKENGFALKKKNKNKHSSYLFNKSYIWQKW